MSKNRDLAAQNCMVSADKVVKIGDLGLAQQMNVLTSHRSLPFRWMAPESIAH